MVSFPIYIIVSETRAICKSDRASFLFFLIVFHAPNQGARRARCSLAIALTGRRSASAKAAPMSARLCLCPRRAAKRAAALVVAQSASAHILPFLAVSATLGGFLGLRPRAPRPSPAARAPPTPCRRRSVALLRRSLTDKNETHPLLGAAFRLYGRAVLAFLRLKSLESGQKRAVFVLAAALPRLLPPVAPLRLLVGLSPALRADRARQARPILLTGDKPHSRPVSTQHSRRAD